MSAPKFRVQVGPMIETAPGEIAQEFWIMRNDRECVARTTDPEMAYLVEDRSELCAALELLLDDPTCEQCRESARAALAKARGEG